MVCAVGFSPLLPEGMVQNKLEHCLLGMGVCAFGIVGYSQGWLGAGKMLFLVVAVLGGFWGRQDGRSLAHPYAVLLAL